MDTTSRTQTIQPYPSQPAAPGRPPRRWTPLRTTLAVVAGLVALCGAAALGWNALLYAVNPVGDEWICSQGEVPTGAGCYPEDETLPAGVEADPYGNRPMPYNCDKSGWVQVARPAGDGSVVGDCVKEGTDVPDTWYVFD